MQTSIHSSKMVDPSTGTLLLSISYNAAERKQDLDKAALYASVAAQTDNHLIPIQGSFVKLDSVSSAFTDVVVCKVAKGKTVLPFTEDHNFKSVSGNLFMDEAENFWSLSEEAGSQVFIKDADAETPEELQSLLSSVSSARNSENNYIRNAQRDYDASLESISATDLVVYAANGELKHGSVCPVNVDNPSVLQVCTSSEVVDVQRDAVVMSLSSDQFAANIEEPAESQSMNDMDSSQRLIEYFTKVFGHNENFLNELVTRIKSHAFA